MRPFDFGGIIAQAINVADLDYEDEDQSESRQDKPDRDLTLESRLHYTRIYLSACHVAVRVISPHPGLLPVSHLTRP